MTIQRTVALLLVTAAMALPGAALADRERGYDKRDDDCYEHKGKQKCRGEKKERHRKERQHTAGGPPPWAPAHGWRRKQGEGVAVVTAPVYEDRHAYEEERVVRHDTAEPGGHGEVRMVVDNGYATVDVGIESGTCNHQAIGAVIGGVVGGAVGNRVGSGDHREVSTVLGVVIGALVGRDVGRKMGAADQQCTGQVLEQAPDRHMVRWDGAEQGSEYRVTPQRSYQRDGRDCRDFVTEYSGTQGIERESGTACRNSEGGWERVRI